MTNFSGAVTEFNNNSIKGTEWNAHLVSAQTNDFVNKNDSDNPRANTHHEIVNNTEHLNMEAQLMLVNSENGGLKMENHFEDDEEGNESD